MPDESILQQADTLAQQRNPGFETENLPSPQGFEARQIAPFAIPGTGENTDTGNINNGKEAYLNSFKNSILGTPDSPTTPGRTPSFSASDVFNPRYNSILPGEDSEEAFALGQPWYKKWGNSLVKMLGTAGGTFVNGMTAIPDTLASLNGGTPYDTTAGNAIDEWLKNMENSFPNYYSKWEQEHPFMSAMPFSGGFSNFWGDKFIKNLGFAVGAIGSAVVTDLAVGALTEGIGAIPLVGSQVGRAALWLNKIFTGGNKAEELMSLGAAAGRTGEQLMRLRDLARAASASKVMDGTRFAIGLYGSSAAEAGFEARDAYNTVRQDLLQAYQRENGYTPIGDELREIENYARAAGNVRFGANLALLSVSNAIQFDTFLKPFSAAKAGYKGAIKRNLEAGRQFELVGDRFQEVIPQGLGAKVWSKVRPFAPAFLTEGVYEEGGQYAAQIGTENYYERKYLYDKGLSTKQYSKDETPWDARNHVANIVHSVVEGLGAEFGTDEGLENILLGGITGVAFTGFTNWRNKEHNAKTRVATLNLLNSQGVTDILQNNYDTATQAQRISEDMQTAIKNNDIFKYKNFQHEQFAKFVTSGLKANRFDVRMEQLETLKDMSEDEFKKAFGLNQTTENVTTASQLVDVLKQKASDIKRSYDIIGNTFTNPFIFNKKAITEEELLENEKHTMFENWKEDLTYIASVPIDVENRKNAIGIEIRSISSSLTPQMLANLTNRGYISAMRNLMQSEIESLEGVISEPKIATEDDKKRLSSLKKKISHIDSTLAQKDPSEKASQDLFTDLINYVSNGQQDPDVPIIPVESIPQLIEYGKDVNRLNSLRESAYVTYDKISTEEGFNRYFREAKASMDKAETEGKATQSTVPKTPAVVLTPDTSVPEDVEIIPTVAIKNAEGETKLFEKDKDYTVQLGEGLNPEQVKIVTQLPDGGIVVEKTDGTTIVVPADKLFQEDTLSEELAKDIDEVTKTPEIPPPGRVGTKEGDSKKDLSFGIYSTTDPSYNNKTTPDNNFQRRHQNFLFNLGSSDSKVFNQDNKERLRIIPVNASTQSLLGFPAQWVAGDTTDVNNSVIRAVYVIDDRTNEFERSKLRTEILNAVKADEGIADHLKDNFKRDPQGAIDLVYDQYNSGESTRNEAELSFGEEIIDLILAYKQDGVFFTNEHGEKLGPIGETIDPNEVIYSTFANTDLQFTTADGSREERYTNKSNLDTERVKDWWAARRKSLLDIRELDQIPMFQFDVSRGIPNSINKGAQNAVTEVGLIEEQDLDTPVVTIATQDKVTILGAFNEEGAGIRAATTGVKMPLGVPLLNYGGNLIFLNNRNLTQDEASNIFDLLRILSDRTTSENKSAIFKYLNKIVFLNNPRRDNVPSASSITIDGSNLRLGSSPVLIFMSPDSLDANKEQIIDFFTNPSFFHAVNNAELLRIANNIKADDLQFIELGVEDGKVIQKETWKNYNYYLLSPKAPNGKNRGTPPLTTNIAIPQEGEVPIIQKYAVPRSEQFDTSLLVAPPTPVKAAPAPAIEKKREEQGITKFTDEMEFVEVKIGNSLTRLAFIIASRDAAGNITDVQPVGRIEAGDKIVPFKDPTVVKNLIITQLNISQIKQDETNQKSTDDFWDDPNLNKGSDSQYRLFVPGNNDYKKADIEKEFSEVRELLPDFIQFKTLDHLIRTTSGGFAWGALQDSMIYVYQNAEVGTTYHEAFEAVWQYFLSGEQQQVIYDELLTRKGEFTTYQGIKKAFNKATVKEAKEQIAEEFRDFKMSGIAPAYPRQRNFFQRLIDFIRKVIFGYSGNVTALFKKINKGYYRNYAANLRNPTTQAEYREIGMDNFAEAVIQDTMQGMTAELFSDLFKENSSIIVQLEENPDIAARDIYDKLKARFEHYFENTSSNDTLAAEMKTRRDNLTTDDDREAIKLQYRSIVDLWRTIKSNWGPFVKEHQRYLRVFSVEFMIDDDGNLSFDDQDLGYDENRNIVEYARDIFTIDAKNNASSKVRLLLATISDSVWKKPTEAALGATRIEETIIKRDASIITLPKLAPYAKLFNYLLHTVSNINGIYEMWDKLRGIVSNPELRKGIDANVQRLMNRLHFNNGFEQKTIDQAKLILSLENALSKQKPAFFRQFTDYLRNTYFKTSVTNSKIDQLKASWMAGIKASSALLPSGNNQFLFSPTIIGIKDPIQFLSKIGINFNRQDFNKLKGKNITLFNQAVNSIQAVIEKAAAGKIPIPVVSSKQIDFDSRLNDLANIYVTYIVGDDTQSQHPNLDNEPTSNFVLNNFVSTILSDANNSSTRDEFINRVDNQYFNDIFHNDSVLLNRIIFDDEGKFSKPVEIGVVEGRETWDQNNRATSSLTEAERQLYEINNNLNGVFYTLLPADAKTEWAINVGTYYSANNFFADDTSRANEITKFSNQMYKWLGTEVDLARDYDNRKDITALNRKVGDRVAGNSLRFFRDILPKELVDRINKEIIDDGNPLDTVLAQGAMRTYMREMLDNKAKNSLQNLVDWKVVSTRDGTSFVLNGFDRAFLENYIGKKSQFTATEVNNLLIFREMNYITNNIEVHKFFFGDPAQYKDLLKRIKSFLSGREVTHIDTINTSEGFNQWANINLNKVDNISLSPTDPGYQQYKNHANTVTVFDIDFESDAYEEIKGIIGENADPYTLGNEDDAGAYMTASSYREVLYKAGGRFTAAQEKQFQWEMAWERNDKATEGLYVYSSRELEKADNELLKNDSDEDVAFPILKLVHSGIQFKDGIAISSLDKASWAPLFYRWYKGRNLGNLYNEMQKRGIDYVRMESAHKVGIQKSASLRLYDDTGGVNSSAFNTVQTEAISFKQFGIQVEQNKKDKGQTEGSQARKIVIGDLRNNGVPIDFSSKYAKKEIAFSAWNEMSEEGRIQNSPIYAKIKRHDEAISSLTNVRTDATMRRLGITIDNDGIPVIKDKKRVSDFILSELERRELPRNIARGLEIHIDPTTGETEFSQPLEANAQYSKIRSILYSVIEKTIMRPKVNGGQKTLLAVTGMEVGPRVVKRTVNGKPIYTSGALKFYKIGEGSTEACEVMLPFWFGKKLKEAGSGRTKEEVIKYLNNTEEGQELLRGIGFRIPTQGLNSMDFFVVKDFLPEQMGDVIVLPSEITVKAGSDFDIDKLNTYLKNYYIDGKTGYPKIIRYKGSEEATKEYLAKLVDEGNLISAELRGELDRYISEEQEDYEPGDFLMKIPGVSDMFSEGALTDEYLGYKKNILIDMYYQKALENEYFNSVEALLALPENFGRLVTPNDASELKGLRSQIKKLKGAEDASLGEYGKLLDSNFMMQERHAYMVSKRVVGVSATSQTAHAISQNLNGGLIIYDPSIVARFPHNIVEGRISMSGLYITGTDRLISNINSQTTDGGVDVAKDKFLAEMGINQDTLSTFLTIVRMGSKPWWAVLYLNQPAIQEFLKLKAIHSSVSQINPQIRNEPDFKLLEQIYTKFGGIGKNKEKVSGKPATYGISNMEEAIKDYAAGKPLTQEQQVLQLMMLDDYLRWNKGRRKYEGYNSLAWEMFHFYQGYNWDTARINDPNLMRLKLLKYNKANSLMITPASVVMKDTFVGTMKNNAQLLDAGLRSLINVQVGAAGKVLDKLASDVFYTGGLDEYTRQSILLSAELSMVDYAVQTNGLVNGKTLNTFLTPLILGEKSIARYIKAIQEYPDKRLRNNEFIKNLIASIDTRQGYPSLVQLIERDYDTYTSNVWTDAFRELKEDITAISINDNPNDDRTVAQIYNNLVLAAILQSGSKKSAGSMSHLIPNESYSQFTRDALRNLQLPGFYDNLVIYRTNWGNSKLVPSADLEWPEGSEFDINAQGDYPLLGEGSFLKNLRETMGVEKTPGILHPIAWKFRKHKVIKIVNSVRDPKTKQIVGQRVRLFQRIDVDTQYGTAPLAYTKNRIVFKEINAWGDGNKIQEYYTDTSPSILPDNVKVNEASDEQVVYALYKSGAKMNISELSLYTTIQNQENNEEGPTLDDDGINEPEPPSNDVYLQVDEFETFKNQLQRRNC